MKFRSKFKNLFIVVMLCLISVVPIFSRSINVKADTNQIPIVDIEPTMFYIDIYYYEDWYLLIDKDMYQQHSNHSQVCGWFYDVTYYEYYQACTYVSIIFDYLVYQEWYLPDEWYNLIDFSSYDFPSFEHYKSKYYLIPITLFYQLDWGETYISHLGVELHLKNNNNESYLDITYYEDFDIINFYEKQIMPLSDSYNLGLLDGKVEAFNNYDKLLPITLGSIGMFFISIFGSINVFGMSLLTVFGIVGALLLVWYVLRLVMG